MPRNRMGTGEVASTQSSTWRENARFCKTGSSEKGRYDLVKEANPISERLDQEPKGS